MVAPFVIARGRGPLVVWVAGIASLVVGAFATATYIERHDLYVSAHGAVCSGGSSLDVCYGIDQAAFEPDVPDLSSYQPHGFGYVEPALVPGGIIYVSRYRGGCQVEAIQLEGRLSARSGFGILSTVGSFGWGLPVGIALLFVAGVMYSSRRDLSPRVRTAGLAAVTAEAGLAGLYALVTFVFLGIPLAMAPATAVAILSIVFVVMALIGYCIAIGLTLQLTLRREPRGHLKVAVVQTSGALVALVGLVAVSLSRLAAPLWC